MADSAEKFSPVAERPLAFLTTEELLWRYAVFASMNAGAANPMVSAMESAKKALPFTAKLSNKAFHKTAGRVFFGGETLDQAKDRCASLMQRGHGVIIDYMAPENSTGLPESHYAVDVPNHLREVIAACGELKSHSKQTVSLAIKVSTLADSRFLESVSAKLEKHAALSEEESAKYDALRNRFNELINKANAARIKPFIDAEESKINPLIRDLCYGAAKEGMKLSMTVQAYLQETPQVVDELLARPREERPDIKLVRGAYMGEKYVDERPLIWPTKEGTDSCYDESFARLYGHVGEITAATHNQQSLRAIAGVMATQKNGTKVNTATLLGMGDGLWSDPKTEKLKYVPYGDDVGYFLRRGVEFAMNPVKLDDGREVTRGQAELELVQDELCARGKELNPFLRKAIEMAERDAASRAR
jgi:hypothetical protein